MTGGIVNEQLWWYVARSGGIVAMVLIVASVVWGLLLSSKYLQGGPKPKGLLNIHRFLGGLSVIFTGIHLVALWLDSYVTFTLADLLVPFASAWKPAEVAAGVVAFWLLLAVQGTSLMMKRLPRHLWKWIHLGSYALLPLGLLHAITAGTDAGQTWFRFGAAGMIGLVTWLTAWRAIKVTGRTRRGRAGPRGPAHAEALSSRTPTNVG